MDILEEMRPLFTPLTQEEAQPFLGCRFTQRDGQYNQRVVVVDRIGKSGGVCWYREVEMHTVSETPERVRPDGGRTVPFKVLMAGETVPDAPSVRGMLRYSEIHAMLTGGTGMRPVQLRVKGRAVAWDIAEDGVQYTVLQDGYKFGAPTNFQR